MKELLKQRFYSSSLLDTSALEEINFDIERDVLLNALVNVGAANLDSEISWTQISFPGKNKLVFSSLTHSSSIRFEISSKYSGKGVVKISGKQLYDYVKQLPQASVSISIDLPASMKLKCGRSTAKMQLIQDESSHDFAFPEKGTSVLVKGSFLERWISSFRDFVSVDDNRFYANGSLIWLAKDKKQKKQVLYAVASDALRLAQSKLTSDFQVEEQDEEKILVPKKILEEVKRISSQEPDTHFRLKWHAASLSFLLETDKYRMVARCIAGQYPPYEAALPKKESITLDIDLKSAIESVRRMILFTDKNKVIKMNFEKSTLKMTSFTPGQKEGEEFVELLAPVETDFEVSYNGSLLMAILNSLTGSKATLTWESSSRPVKITGEGQNGIEVFYLLVPTRY